MLSEESGVCGPPWGGLGSGRMRVEQEWSIAALLTFTCWTRLLFEQRVWGQRMKTTASKSIIY